MMATKVLTFAFGMDVSSIRQYRTAARDHINHQLMCLECASVLFKALLENIILAERTRHYAYASLAAG